jgi:O-antigen ligase
MSQVPSAALPAGQALAGARFPSGTRIATVASQGWGLLSPLLVIYFVGLYIRPQDWMTAMLGLPVDWIIFGTLLAFVPFRIHRIPVLLSNHTFLLLLAWLGVIVMSNLVHSDSEVAKEQFTYYVKFVIVFVSFMLYVESPSAVRMLMWAQLLMIAFLAYQSFYQFANGVNWAGQTLGWDDGFGGRPRWVGLWNGPNTLCLLFVTAFPFLMEFITGPWNPLSRVLASGLLVLVFQAIVLSQSRGGFIALLASLGFWFLYRFKLGKGLIVGAIGIACLVALGPARAFLVDDRDTSKSGHNRVEMWFAGFEMLKAEPVLGVGKGLFQEHGRHITGLPLIAHNSYVQNMAETGLAGLWIYIALPYVAVMGLFQARAKADDPREKSVARALTVGLLGYIAASMFLTTDFDLWYVQLGLIAAYCSSVGASATIKFKDFVRISVLTIGFVIALYVFLLIYF